MSTQTSNAHVRNPSLNPKICIIHNCESIFFPTIPSDARTVRSSCDLWRPCQPATDLPPIYTLVTGYGFSAGWNGSICSKCMSAVETQSRAKGVFERGRHISNNTCFSVVVEWPFVMHVASLGSEGKSTETLTITNVVFTLFEGYRILTKAVRL